MPSFGGFAPFPLRLGGGRTRLQGVLDGLNASRGSAFDTETTTTTVYVENMAVARAISAAWGTNARLGTLWDPWRMPEDVLSRWEYMLVLAPGLDDTVYARRAALTAAMAHFGSPSIAGILGPQLADACGDAFVSIDHIDYANALIFVPDGTYPWGTVGPADKPWSSTVAHVLVRLQTPAGWTEAQFYEAAGQVSLILDPALPAWATFDWYRPGPVSVNVSGGPTAGGFYTDDDHNLDNEVFDV